MFAPPSALSDFPVTKQDIQEHFSSQSNAKITEIKIMNGFGFIEFEDPMDARDIVPAFHGSDLNGVRLTVQFARGSRHKESFHGDTNRPTPPRPRRTIYRMQISSLPSETSWQDLKDFARQPGLDVVYSETSRDRDGKGFVEFETEKDLKTAVERLDGREFKGSRVTCTADTQPAEDRSSFRDPYRSRSPRRSYNMEDWERPRPSPRGYSPRGHYRERSPPSRHEYYGEGYGRRTPPHSRIEDYAHRRYDDLYDPRLPPPPPPPRPYEDPYLSTRSYGRRTPPRSEYPGYRRYW